MHEYIITLSRQKLWATVRVKKTLIQNVQLILKQNILKYKTDQFITQPTESFEKLKDHDAKQMILTN